jgi:hypothetical protein
VNATIGFKSAILLWLIAILVGGCHYSSAGSVKKSPEVGQAFNALHVYPNHRYYFLNHENNPYGVVALENAYWIKDPVWREVDPQSEAFRKIVGLVQSFPVPRSHTEGYTLHDPQGMPIGVWYSSLGAGITVDPETRRVAITTATRWLSR